MADTILRTLKEIVGEERVLTNEPMNRHTTFRIGGPADYFVIPETEEQVGRTLEFCRTENIPQFILGNGSNLLVSDTGFRGVIVRLDKNFSAVEVQGNIIRAQAGALLSRIASEAKEASLAGMEFASGIPGTLGGAVTMNAGAYGGELKQVLKSARVFDEDLALRTVTVGELEMGYRTSRVKTDGWVVLEAVLELPSGNREEIASKMEVLKEKRVSKQPLEFPSAGSTFKRPEGYFAGKLIMDAQLAGFSVGDARVSEKHCGFVINTGEATAADVYTLIRRVQETVFERFGVELEPEVRFLGEF